MTAEEAGDVDDLDAAVARDPALARLRARVGPPPAFTRPEGLSTLVLLILEQQLSLRAAGVHFARLGAACGGRVTAGSLLDLDDGAFLTAGVSRQKRRYLRDLAARVADGRLDVAALAGRTDDEVVAALCDVLGIGVWTAQCYLLAALGRPDVLPSGDLAVRAAVADLDGLDTRPTPREVDVRGRVWAPHRSAATRLLWHGYLRDRGRRT